MWCRAAVVQGECGVAESGAVWCRASGAVWCGTSSRVWCRAVVVQGGCGAGECGAVWCRARVVQCMVQNKVQGVVCRASVV